MSGKNIHEIEANQDVDTTKAFEGAFPAQPVDELLLEFDPKHSGPPIVTLLGDGGASKTIHPRPQLGREGRFATQVGGPERWNRVKVGLAHTMASGKPAKLVRVKLIAKGAT